MSWTASEIFDKHSQKKKKKKKEEKTRGKKKKKKRGSLQKFLICAVQLYLRSERNSLK